MTRSTREARLLANLRPPPAYQEYGSDLLNLETITLMSLAERGLLATMRWKIWANDSLPRDPEALAKLLGLELQIVRANLSERVLTFFAPMEGNPERLVCPELAAQKNRLLVRQQKLSQSGRRGGMSTKHKEKNGAATLEATSAARLQASGKPPEMRRAELKRAESSKDDAISTTPEAEVVEMRRAFGEIR